MTKKILSIMIATATILSLICCIPVNAAYHTTPFVFSDFNDGEGVNEFFASANNANVTDSIIEGVAGSAGAFQRSYNLNTAPAAYCIPKSNSFAPEMFSGSIRVSFWFKIDPTVGTLTTTTAEDGTVTSSLSTLHPRFYVTSGTGANKELQSTTYTKTGWDAEAINRGEWVFIEMTSNANGAFSSYELQSTDTIALQLRFNGVSNTANRGWTDTNCIAYAIDDFKIEKVVDAEDTTLPYAKSLKIDGNLESNGAWGTYYGNSDSAKQGETISADNSVTLSYTYMNDTGVDEGSSLVRVLRETAPDSGEYAVIKQYTRTDSNSFTYQLSEDWIGRRMKMEVVPVDANGVYGVAYSMETVPVKSAADPSVRLNFDTSTETGSGAFFVGRTDVTDTSVTGVVGSGAALKREATISSSCPAPFLQHVFSTNPKDLFMGNFKISLWFKLNADVTQLYTSSSENTYYADRLFIVLQNNSDNSSWNLHLPFPADKNVNDGEWMYLECDAYEINRFNGASANLNTAADDQAYTLSVRVGTYSNLNNSDIIKSDGNILSYCIDDFKIEKIVDSYSGTDSTYGRPYVTEASVAGNMVSGSAVDVDYTYNIDRAANTESNQSVIRVLRETAAGSDEYGVVASYTKETFPEEGYTLTDAWLGKKMKVEITPVAADGTYGATYEAVSESVMPEYQVSTTLSDLSGSDVSATASVLNNYRDGEDDKAFLIVAVYDADGRMIRCETKDFTVPNTAATAQTAVATEETLPVTLTADELADADIIKALLWSYDGTYIPLASEKFIDVN